MAYAFSLISWQQSYTKRDYSLHCQIYFKDISEGGVYSSILGLNSTLGTK